MACAVDAHPRHQGRGGGVCRALFPSQPQGPGTRKLSLVGPESLVLRAGQSSLDAKVVPSAPAGGPSTRGPSNALTSEPGLAGGRDGTQAMGRGQGPLRSPFTRPHSAHAGPASPCRAAIVHQSILAGHG